jgi:hypothetical protein
MNKYGIARIEFEKDGFVEISESDIETIFFRLGKIISKRRKKLKDRLPLSYMIDKVLIYNKNKFEVDAIDGDEKHCKVTKIMKDYKATYIGFMVHDKDIVEFETDDEAEMWYRLNK